MLIFVEDNTESNIFFLVHVFIFIDIGFVVIDIENFFTIFISIMSYEYTLE